MKSREELDREFYRKLQVAKDSSKELQNTLENSVDHQEAISGRREE